MSPYFSVIIPTLNEEKYLPNLLNSLYAQTSNNFEIIVIDGKSEDKTAKIVKAYSGKFSKQNINLRLLISPQRSSASQRNMGARHAKGQCFVFFDADIVCNPNYLVNIWERINTKKSQFCTTYVKGDKSGIYESFISYVVNMTMDGAKLIGRPLCIGFNTIVAKDVFFKVGGFDPRVNVIDDYDFSLRAGNMRIRLDIYRDLRIQFSLRRFRSEGWFKTFFKYVGIAIYTLIMGVPKKQIFVYPMGGQVHESK
ncbi:glycosyltransferase [Candidatus Gottesmanbacteria bacterium]|nr:glycosyltransferase [Candidatus Gottesmanbacteria bacterium]